VPAAVAFAGRVVDEAKRPIAGALVLVNGPGLPPLGPDVADVAAVPDAVLARSDDRGRFAVADLRPGPCTVRVEHERFVPESLEVPAREPASDCGDVVLLTLRPLHGVVVDWRGEPVPGARVVPGGAGELEELQPRRAVVTDALGAFTLPCFGASGGLTVFAAGHEPLAVRCEPDDRGPVRLVVQPANALHGRVLGVDRGGALTVVMPDGGYWRGAQWVHDVIYREHPIAADGTFRITAVPRGRWLVSAAIPGAGRTAPCLVDVPLAAPLELELDAAQETAVVVRVVDDLGASVASATVVRVTQDELPDEHALALANGWFGWTEREQTTTDDAGRTVVHVPAGKPLLLAARTPRHVVATAVAAADALPASVEVVLTRGAAIEGTLADAGLSAHLRFHVQCMAASAPPGSFDFVVGRTFLGGSAVDRAGRFRLGPLPAGKVRVELLASDASHASSYAPPVPRPVPLLAAFEPLVPAVELELGPAETRSVSFAVPALGEIAGRVLQRGAPFAGAIVYGRAADGRDQPPGLGEDDDPERTGAHEWRPHVRTDAEGRFRFLVASAGTWHLRARAENAQQWTPACAVAMPVRDARRTVDLVLSAASIRGTWSLADVEPRRRRLLEAQLHPLADAHHDPFLHGDCTTSRSWLAPKRALDRGGAFAFDGVPEGTWVVRVVESGVFGPILCQRAVTVARDEPIDLGALERPARVQARVRTGVDAETGVWLASPVGGNEHGLFLATVPGAHEGSFHLGALPPGRYLLRPFRRGMHFLGDWGVRGTALGEPAAIEVHADGSTTPEVVWPHGIR
jgi:hypothetical protein